MPSTKKVLIMKLFQLVIYAMDNFLSLKSVPQRDYFKDQNAQMLDELFFIPLDRFLL